MTRWLAVLLAVQGCAAEPEVRQEGMLRGEGLGTTWIVRWAVEEGVSLSHVQDAVVGALTEVDAGMSTWRDDSELSAVRRGPGAVAVSEDTAFVTEEALRVAAATRGAFDPTVQPLMEAWGLHGGRKPAVPDEAELAAARAQVGWQRVRVSRGEGGHAQIDAGGAALDLSAIAKGHAVDRVALAVSALGVADVFVEIGGEVRAHGTRPRGGVWTIGVEAPIEGAAQGDNVLGRLRVSNHAVATSGNYRTTVRDGDRVIHHTMDPRTGAPAVNLVRSATVIAPDCRSADAWATALMVLGPEGMAHIDARPELEAWLLVEAEDGELVGHESGGLRRFVVSSEL